MRMKRRTLGVLGSLTTALVVLVQGAVGCGGEAARQIPSESSTSGPGGFAGAGGGEPDPLDNPNANSSDGGAGGQGEPQPEPAPGGGVWEPPTSTLHDHRCAGLDSQILNHFITIAHKAPELGSEAALLRCVQRYAGWVTNKADAAKLSRASVYAALEASDACVDGAGYAGIRLSPSFCEKLRPELAADACATKLATDPEFGIDLAIDALKSSTALKAHGRDPVRMGAWLANGSVACGGTDRWKLVAPVAWLDRYTQAYNAVRVLAEGPPKACSKRLVVSFALYSALGTPGADGVPSANGCWTYERISKENSEWKLCNYDGTTHHPSGSKWTYDDTSSNHSATVEQERIKACRSGVPGRGYIYMTNRGNGWVTGSTSKVHVHFAELYSSQYTVDDQLAAWLSDGKPGGAPMLNFGEPATSTTTIAASTAKACKQVKDGGFLGVYIYPTALKGARLTAVVNALNACTKK